MGWSLPTDSLPECVLQTVGKAVQQKTIAYFKFSIPIEPSGFRPGRNCCYVRSIEIWYDGYSITGFPDTNWRKFLLFKFYNLLPSPLFLLLLRLTMGGRIIIGCLGRKERSSGNWTMVFPTALSLPLYFSYILQKFQIYHPEKIFMPIISLSHKDLRNTRWWPSCSQGLILVLETKS